MRSVPRSLPTTLGLVVVFVLLLVAGSLVVGALFAAPLTSLAARSGQRVGISEWLGLITALAATAVMVRAVDVRSWRDLGLARDAARPRLFGYGWCLGGLPIAAACGLLLAVGWLHVVPSTGGSELGAAVRISFVLVPAALSEEVMCRGYLLTLMRDSFGIRGAVIATSALFGLVHIANPGSTAESVALVTLAGIFLAAVRVAFDSLYAAWAAHLSWNWVMAVPFHAPVSGRQFEAPDYRLVSTGPEWVTGGTWGPEGGVAAALAMVAVLAYLYTRRRREES